MSIKIMSRVWESSKQKGTDLLLLLALADNADDNGYCWPGIEYLRKKIRMTNRSVINAIGRLEKSGEIIAVHNRRLGNRYLVTVGMSDKEKQACIEKLGCENFSSETNNTSEVKNIHIRSETAISQEPSITIIESSIKQSDEPIAQQEAFIEPEPPKPNGNALFVALSELCKINLTVATGTQKSQLGQSAKLLKKIDVIPEQIQRFAKYWYGVDWRGKKGQAPTPAQVRAEWGKFKESGYYEEGAIGW